MAILEDEVLVKYSSRTFQHYENLGYVFPKYKDKDGKLRVKRGTSILVKVEHLTTGSNTLVTKICDICNKNVPKQSYASILYCRKNNENGIDLCLECMMREKGIRLGIPNEDNCIATTHKSFANLFWNVEDAHRYTYNSGKKADFKCSYCGNKIKNKIIANVFKQGLSCPYCSDHISYPEKFMFSVLKQLNINFNYQKLFKKWFKEDIKRYYDFYIPSLNCIIETHGKQHYEESFDRYGGRSRKYIEEVENDLFKKEIAIKNKVKEEYYIVIDARESSYEYIKNSILNSNLSKILDLSSIDWLECHKFACKSIVFTVCEMWDKFKNVSEIGRILKLDRATVRRYLKQGSKISLCDYDFEKTKKKPKKVIQLSLQGEMINSFNSIKEASKKCKINNAGISSVCNGRSGNAGGYIWVFKDTYEQLSDEEKYKLIVNANYTKEKEVYQLDKDLMVINKFNSIQEAEDTLSIYHISKVCKNKQNTAGGYKWMYKEDYELYIEQQSKELIHT